jgi:hypothetical protein
LGPRIYLLNNEITAIILDIVLEYGIIGNENRK